MTAEPEPPRLLFIALDALPWRLVREGIDAGELPHLQRLREDSEFGIVSSEADLFPGSVWPTFFTQSPVGEHGVHHLIQWDRHARKLERASRVAPTRPFWQRLAESGIPTIALDVPFSDTGRSTPNATEVIGWGMHEGVWKSSYPAHLLRQLNRRHGVAAQAREGPGERPDSEVVSELGGLVADVGRRVAVVEDLAARFPWRLLIAVFSETHRAGHWFWGTRGTGAPQGGVRRVLRAFDGQVPRLRSLLRPQDQMVVFAIHGMDQTFDVDRLGQLAVAHMFQSDALPAAPVRDPVLMLRNLLPSRLVRTVARRLPQPLYNWTYQRLQNSRRNSIGAAWVPHPLDHLLFLYANTPLGAGDAEPSQEALAHAIDELRGVRTATGQEVVETIVRARDSYQGARVHLLPDIIAKPYQREIGPELTLADGSRFRVPRNSSRDGDHVAEGFYLRSGPGIEAGREGPKIAGEDLARFLSASAGLDL